MVNITVGFQGTSVTVNSDAVEIIEHIRGCFRKMVLTDPSSPARQITVLQREVGYTFLDRDDLLLPYAEMLKTLEQKVIEALIEANSHFLWLHAGAVARDGKALLIVGNAGCGKSTTAIGLCTRGWRYLSDDTLPLDMDSHCAYTFLRTPWFRRMHHQELAMERIAELKTRQVSIDDELIWQGPAALSMIVFPVYHHGGSLLCERLTGTQMALGLISQSRNFDNHGTQALQFVSRLASQIPAWRIKYSDRRLLLKCVMNLWNQHIEGGVLCLDEG